jgi:hypothetical protein
VIAGKPGYIKFFIDGNIFSSAIVPGSSRLEFIFLSKRAHENITGKSYKL